MRTNDMELMNVRTRELQHVVSMSSPDINERDVQAVVNVLRSGRLACGPKAEEFERRIARYVGVSHAVAVNSGTAALHLIVRALGLGPGDEVLVPSFTFAASVNAILYEGARPVFVDIDPATYNLDPADLERKLSDDTKAIMVVDAFGHPAEWDDILRFAENRALQVIDDSCEALGAEYKGQKLGGFGDAAAFAFYPNKQITTGEGGVIVTDDAELARAVRSMRNQGREEGGPWLRHSRLGFNYRLNEMSAALGCSQLRRLDEFLARRALVAEMYTSRLSAVPGVKLPIVKNYVTPSWFVYVVTLPEGSDCTHVIPQLEKRGVPAREYFHPIHTQPYLLEAGSDPGLPATDRIAGRTLALPFHNKLTEREVDIVVEALAEALAEYE